MRKLRMFLAMVLWTVVLTAGLHWLNLKADEPFFSFSSDDVATFIAGLLTAAVVFLSRDVKKLDGFRRGWNLFWQNRWVLLIASIFLLALPVGMMVSGEYDDATTRMKVLCWVSLVFFGSIFVFVLREFIGRKESPRYDSDQHYLYLLSTFKRTPIEWKHITGFNLVEVEQMGHKKMIAVQLNNIEELRANETRRSWRMAYDMFVPQYGTPYFISTERCVLTPEQLLVQLQAELHRHLPG